MQIRKIIWSEDTIEHIARHGVEPEEFEQTCFGNPLILRAKSRGKNPVYYILGQTHGGRYLFCIIIRFRDGNGYPVTARDMTNRERTRYSKWKNR